MTEKVHIKKHKAFDKTIVEKAQQLENALGQKGMIKNRRYKLKEYKNCFIGSDAVNTIIALKVSNNIEQAQIFGNQLMQANIIKHVQRDHMFKNENLYYEFIDNYFQTFMTNLNQKKKPQSYKINKRPMDDSSGDESDKKPKKLMSKEENKTEDEPSLGSVSFSNLNKLAEYEDKRHTKMVLQRQTSETKIALSDQEKLFVNLKKKLSLKACTIIVFGASGHLAKTKTFPALYDLYLEDSFPDNVQIIGYARSKLSKSDFHKKISLKLKGNNVSDFLSNCTYFSGKGYDDDESFKKFNSYIESLENNQQRNRLIYLATPPSVFVAVCERIKKYLMTDINDDDEDSNGFTRVIIEKPFGKDLDSSNKLEKQINKYLKEENVYRIDHYLAKEMVQNILVFRFSNVIWDAIWNRKYIKCIKISMKETATLDGRGGYYDEYGVIRDVLQNHLMQVLTLIAMEQPVSLKAEDIRDEKVKVLKCIAPMEDNRTIVGQYGKSVDGKKQGYRDDPSIKNSKNPNSNQITFVQTVLFVNNHRWAHTPFICKCGKGLDAKNTEIRIQFRNDGLCLFPDANFNEIVMRLQPNEAIWCKVNAKTPGFARFDQAMPFELDLTYKDRLGVLKLPAAYTRLILDSLLGDQSLFVRSDELRESWRIVSPYLNQLESSDKDPPKYARGSRGPLKADKQGEEYGFRTTINYSYKNQANL